MDPTTYSFLSGMIMMGYVIAAVFFLKFWHRTRDTLFAIFSAAFLLLALNQTILALGNIVREERSWVYLIRLVAFGLIIVAIARKNMGGLANR